MTNFAKIWLAAPEKVKALFKPDEFQPLVCPECFIISGTHDSAPCECPCRRYYIPRLGQLLGMVQTSPIELFIEHRGKGGYLFTMFDYNMSFQADSSEEAVLKGICWEQGGQTPKKRRGDLGMVGTDGWAR